MFNSQQHNLILSFPPLPIGEIMSLLQVPTPLIYKAEWLKDSIKNITTNSNNNTIIMSDTMHKALFMEKLMKCAQ